LFFLTALGSACISAAGEPKNVLLLNSYRAGYVWTDELVRGISQELESQEPLELWVEYMDVRRRGIKGLFDEVQSRLRSSHRERRFDLIITTDDEAYDFIQERGESLFPGVAAVFSGIGEAKAREAPRNRFTGVIESFNPKDTLRKIAALHPSVEHVYAVVDDSNLSQPFMHELQGRRPPFSAASMAFLHSGQMSFGELRTRLSRLPPNSLVLFCAAAWSGVQPVAEAVRGVGAEASSPVYALTSSVQSKGVLASSASGGIIHAGLVTGLAARILAGERPETVPLLVDDYIELVFDYHELARWGISPDAIKPPWKVVNRPATFYGEYRTQIWSAAAFGLLQAIIIGALVVTVGKKRRAERSLQSALVAANAAAEAKSRFLANVSHELKTPLNGIIGVSDLMKATPLDREQAEYLSLLRNSSVTLAQLVDDLLDLTQAEGGRLKIATESFFLKQELSALVQILKPEAEKKALKLTWHAADTVPERVQGDPVRLRQILANLLANSLKFTTHGEVSLYVTANNDYAANSLMRFEVTDTGPGISPEDQSRIFDRFTQVDESSTRRAGGAGIGLALCRQLADLMRGRIGVNAQVGKGSTFWVELPLPPERN
jgi:signal transduction histidine kinase